MILEEKFTELQKKKEKALVGFLTAGDPTPELCADIALAMGASGVDILELGIPFSDPTADDPVIQRAFKRALENETDVLKTFSIIKKIREKSDIPIVIFSYFNPIFTFGEKQFCEMAIQAGANGVVVIDLPFGERSIISGYDSKNFPKIELIAPATKEDRLQQISTSASGFLYQIPMPGAVETNKNIMKQGAEIYVKIKKQTKIPVCSDFGVKTEDDVKKVANFSDGVVIGTSFIEAIEQNLQHPDIPLTLSNLAVKYKQATKN